MCTAAGAAITATSLTCVRPQRSLLFRAQVDQHTGRSVPNVLKGEEQAIVHQVTAIAPGPGARRGAPCTRTNVTLRFNRGPCIGDKFASRAGQKGVLGQLWPDVDLPYCAATGMRPDLLINPHAFPSRMTIGMLIESAASKAGALGGQCAPRLVPREISPLSRRVDALHCC